MKELVFIFIAIVALCIVSSCNLFGGFAYKIADVQVFDTDYTKKYESTLNAMFDNKFFVKSVEEKYADDCGCDGLTIGPHQFLEWNIEYRDGNEELRNFTLDNRSSLSGQIEEHVRKYVAAYYKEHFYDRYIKDLPVASSSYVYGFFVRASVNPQIEDSKEWKEKTGEYRKLLDTPDGTITLAKLTPANAFEMCPLYLTINISLSGRPSSVVFHSGPDASPVLDAFPSPDASPGPDASPVLNETQRFEENAMKQVEDMIEAMNIFTNSKLNADISIGYHENANWHTGDRQYWWSIIKGKQVYNVSGHYYSGYVFESYKGLFW